MIATTQNKSALHTLIFISGFICLLLSIAMGMHFWASLANDVVTKVIYVVIGITLCCLVVLSLATALESFSRGYDGMGTLLIMAWIVFLGGEVFVEFGFMATAQETKALAVAKDSTQARLAEESVKNAGAKLDSLSQYATLDISAVQGELASLQAELDGAEARLASCPANYKTKCINPARADIARIAKQMEPLEAKVDGYNSYQGAMQSKANANKELGAALSGKDVGMAISPGYIWFSRLSGISPENLQAGTSFIASLGLSLWASFAGFILLRLRKSTAAAGGVGGGDYQVTVQPSAAQSQLTQDDVDKIVSARIATLQLSAPAPMEATVPKP